ncbi:MAG: hypothetical protein O2964_03730 [Verrucomicrobia bacterium]|nr:hypothetical protein [Verrucomicrobiota bacterium]
MWRTLINSLFTFLLGSLILAQPCLANMAPTPHLRHPVKIALINNESQLLLANSRSGSLSLIDLSSTQTTHEWKVAGALSDMAFIAERNQILLTDNKQHSLILLNWDNATQHWDSRSELNVATDPQHIALHPENNMAAIASRWSHRLTLLKSTETQGQTASWRTTEVVDLPFAPGKMVFVPEQKGLLIADAFNGILALFDLGKKSIRTVSHFQINNIANLSLTRNTSQTTVWISGESLNSYATTFNPEVTWGVLMDNQVRAIPLTDLLNPKRSPVQMGTVYGMGDETGPGGDPNAVLIRKNGTLITSLGGVDRVAFRPQLASTYTHRIQVGDRPIDMVMTTDESTLYVANQFSDSISVIDLNETRLLKHISLGPQPMLTEADEGERLFFDASLSLRGWYSCHSCHTDGHTTGLLNDNLGDDHFGSPKRILTLLGAASSPPFSWLGKMDNLEAQIAKSLSKTMLHNGSTDDKAASIARYLETLEAPPSLIHARAETNPDLFHQGRRVFHREGCDECHREPHYTTNDTFNVGLTDKAGNQAFNPPSLLGISQRDTFFHDNSASKIEEVLFDRHHPEPRDQPLTTQERHALIHFLNSL